MCFWEKLKNEKNTHKTTINAVLERCQRMGNPQKQEVKLIFRGILNVFGNIFGKSFMAESERNFMKKKNYKGRCVKRAVNI